MKANTILALFTALIIFTTLTVNAICIKDVTAEQLACALAAKNNHTYMLDNQTAADLAGEGLNCTDLIEILEDYNNLISFESLFESHIDTILKSATNAATVNAAGIIEVCAIHFYEPAATFQYLWFNFLGRTYVVIDHRHLTIVLPSSGVSVIYNDIYILTASVAQGQFLALTVNTHDVLLTFK
jgi:hypothetical protein